MKFMKYIIPTLHLLSTLYCSRYFFRITIFIISEILLILRVKSLNFMFRFKICFLESVFQDSSEPRINFKQYSQLT